ncbi:MAG: hypothetical protein K0A98_13835, partial [Trueperaceae bacterium]|nr:hypothetical protein [Trueperaceae bacterium]
MPHDVSRALMPATHAAPPAWFAPAPARTLGRGDALYRVGEPVAASFAIEAGLVKLSLMLPSG